MTTHPKEGTPRTDSMVTGNSDPTQEEYEDLAYFARTLELENLSLQRRLGEAERLLGEAETKVETAQVRAASRENDPDAASWFKDFVIRVRAHLAHQTSGGSQL